MFRKEAGGLSFTCGTTSKQKLWAGKTSNILHVHNASQMDIKKQRFENCHISVEFIHWVQMTTFRKEDRTTRCCLPAVLKWPIFSIKDLQDLKDLHWGSNTILCSDKKYE